MAGRGGLLCAASGLALLVAATATDFWLQYRAAGGPGCQGLWRVCLGGECRPHAGTPGFLALLGLAVYTAVTVSAFGQRQPDWRFSWSYMLGWVAAVLLLSAGLFHVCAASKDPSPESSEAA
ncbi:lens fiber membrane intrinsic protein-like [Nothoprocta perdicaria]|uniref:lens fiber membrane intrinsic protein-like n=1 Tax=Nothoprocta perdicaria TaxID=30464 RepID=UPI000E1B93A8|nr:lens fiber membrane intrinsic protein-like [Nothoprocta perdicaria]